jgi:soluble lytic murein transglycosylase-like protein
LTPRQIASAAAIAAVITAGAAGARLPQDEVPRVAPLAGWSWIDRPMHVPQRFARDQQRQHVARIVVEEARAHGVPVELALAVAHVESGMRPAHTVTGPPTRYGRAVGTLQVLPSTGRAMGCGNLRDTRQNVRCGVRYLRASLQRHNGDAGMAALEFHGGSNRRLWGPRTQRYRQMVLARMGRGQSVTVARHVPGDDRYFREWWLTR